MTHTHTHSHTHARTHLRPYLLLFALTLAFRLATALPLQQAGYMDASYTLHVAENLARGRGFVEDVLWNYLDNPAGLPHPSNLYWMPLPALLIAPLFAIFGVSYRVAQIPFILLSSLLPPFTFHVSRKIFRRDDYAWASALFTAFSGFYTIYWVSPDNFAPFALTAALCLYAIARGLDGMGLDLAVETASTSTQSRPTSAHSARAGGFGDVVAATSSRRVYWFFLAGILAALSHLSRADGILLLAVAPLALLFHVSGFMFHASRFKVHKFQSSRVFAFRFSLLTFTFLLGYLFAMSPWFLRNYLAVGTPYPSAGTKTLWLTNYDELFRFADDLTLQRYLAWGAGAILESKLVAAVRNLFIIAFGDLQLFLAPFALIGWWQLRKHPYYLPFTIYFLILYLSMTLLFTFPSWRGSLFHSAAALLPFLAVAAPRGIDAVVEWIARKRKAWNAEIAARFFRAGFVAMAVFFSVFLYAQGVFGVLIGEASTIPLWNARDSHYPAIARWLDSNARADEIVMVVDPPSFYNTSHRRAIMLPTDSVDAVFAVARKYAARYFILEFDHPRPLKELYEEKTRVADFQRIAEFRDALNRPVFLYEVRDEP